MVVPRERGLTVHTTYFANKTSRVEGFGKQDQNIKLKPQEIRLAEQLMQSLSEDFKSKKYHDTLQANLKALIKPNAREKVSYKNRPPGALRSLIVTEALKRSAREPEERRRKPDLRRPFTAARSGAFGQ